jgi:hypothetical protein
MLAFGMQPYTANVNNITWGVDDETKDLMLAHIGGDPKTCRITADNKFSSLAFLDKVVKEFNIDPLKEHIFSLDIYQEDDIFVAKITLRSNIEVIDDEPYPGFKANLEKIFETENELF